MCGFVLFAIVPVFRRGDQKASYEPCAVSFVLPFLYRVTFSICSCSGAFGRPEMHSKTRVARVRQSLFDNSCASSLRMFVFSTPLHRFHFPRSKRDGLSCPLDDLDSSPIFVVLVFVGKTSACDHARDRTRRRGRYDTKQFLSLISHHFARCPSVCCLPSRIRSPVTLVSTSSW